MIAHVYSREQDPNAKSVPASFVWKPPSEVPAANWLNMDEIGVDSNNKIGRVEMMSDGFRQAMELTDADNNSYHVTVCLTAL